MQSSRYNAAKRLREFTTSREFFGFPHYDNLFDRERDSVIEILQAIRKRQSIKSRLTMFKELASKAGYSDGCIDYFTSILRRMSKTTIKSTKQSIDKVFQEYEVILFSNDCLSVVIKDIVLEEENFGDIIVNINVGFPTSSINCMAHRNNNFDTKGQFYHPHINENLCLGRGRNMYYISLLFGDVYGAVKIAENTLRTYNASSAYLKLKDWHQEINICENCEQENATIISCLYCDSAMCTSCEYICKKCSVNICGNCIMHEECEGFIYCSECVEYYRCIKCERILCYECINIDILNSICYSCQDELKSKENKDYAVIRAREIRVGDKVRVLRNNCFARKPYTSWENSDYLLPGDIVIVALVNHNTIEYELNHEGNNFLLKQDVELVQEVDELPF